jgi:hypothetical protein
MLSKEPRRGDSIKIAQGAPLYRLDYDGGLIFSSTVREPLLGMFVDYDKEDHARIIISDLIRIVRIEDLREV